MISTPVCFNVSVRNGAADGSRRGYEAVKCSGGRARAVCGRALFTLALATAWSAAFSAPWTPGDITAVGPVTTPVQLSRYAAVHFVSVGAELKGAGEGTSDRPWKRLDQALKAIPAAGPSRRVAVLVAAGTYDHDTISLREHVDVFGGFDPRSWERDIFRHETVLDGLHARRVVLGADHCALDGFIVRRGRAFGHGGGILCDNTSPTISNNRIEECFTVEPVGFRHDLIHQRGHLGGGIACLYNAVPRIANNTFWGNWTEIGEGGALAFFGWVRLPDNPRAVVEHNVFVANTAGVKDLSRTRSSSGGAIACSHEASPVIRHNVIAHNRAMGRSDAGGIYSEFFSSPHIAGNWLVGNEGDDDGGGFYTMRQGEPVLEGNLFAGNWTTGGGVGGVRVSKEGRARLHANVIARNGTGGGIYVADGWVELVGNLVADNGGGPGLRFLQNFEYFQPSSIVGNHFTGNEGGPIDWMENVGAKPRLEENTLGAGPVVSGPGETFAVAEAGYDTARAWTVLRPAAGLRDPLRLVGRAVRAGRRWSVVLRAEADALWVWGDLRTDDAAPVLEVLPEYHPPGSS